MKKLLNCKKLPYSLLMKWKRILGCLNEKKNYNVSCKLLQCLMNKKHPGRLFSVTRWQQRITKIQNTLLKFDALIQLQHYRGCQHTGNALS